jgi:S-DNA-T family DNA segregation ATPase FtsK/SpoIIIE
MMNPQFGKVIQLRKDAAVDIPASAEVEPYDDDIIDGEIVDEEDCRELPVAVEHVRSVTVGAVVVVRRTWESRSTVGYDRMIQAAQAVGDHEKALEWEARRADFRNERHNRRRETIETIGQVIRALPYAGMVLGGALLVIGVLLAIARKDAAQVIAPILGIAYVVNLIATIIALTWLPVLAGGAVGGVWMLWSIGRRHVEEEEAEWIATAGDVDMDVEIDETTIARALGALRIKQINDYLKQGLPLQFIVTARRDGRGTHAVLRLPTGVAAAQIAEPKRRAQLAGGLYRATKEVWLTVGAEAGILDIWAADKGALEEGSGPYPLLEEGFVDVFKGVPYGRTLRGDPLTAPIDGRNTIVGGMPDQGKSSAARIIAAGCNLDITVELRIWVPDSNYDFEVFRPRCSRYVMGAEPEHIEQIRDDLLELHAEIQTRGDLLVKHQQPEVTRELASAGIGLHPLICLLEEAHVAIQDKEFGEEISQLLVDITRLDRKRGIHLIVSTQAPTKDSMPRGVTRNCSNGIAFAVGDHVANDALLGQGAYRGGYKATELIPGVDAGTALIKGFTGQRAELVQAYFLSVRREHDQVTPLIERALAEMKRRGKAVPGTDKERAAIETRDLLDDVDTALHGPERVTLADLASRLRELAPDWPPYQLKTLTGKALKGRIEAALKQSGVQVITVTNGTLRIDPADFRRALSVLSTADLDEE